MEFDIPKLKQSNTFLTTLFDNLTSVILLADKDLKIVKVNNSFEILFDTEKDDALNNFCGESLGCYNTIEENTPCGETSNCSYCELRHCIKESFDKKTDIFRRSLSRDFYINNVKLKKHMQFSTRYVSVFNNEYVVILIDDITDVVQQKLLIEEKNKEITDSIQYAKNIQRNLLPQNDVLAILFSDSFLMYKPKDIISGDFYWTYCSNKVVYCAVADCTGHGVPGALMSVLGVSFLNRILSETNYKSPSKILDRLRDLIMDVLKQKGQEGELTDGMDIVLIAINMETLECQYSGANNSLYIIRNSNGESKLKEIHPDKMPVSRHLKMYPFTNHRTKLHKGDMLYLKTDGFEDQLGGIRDKKFLSKRLKELLLNIHEHPLDEQKDILKRQLNSWKGDNIQTDDVTILGIKV